MPWKAKYHQDLGAVEVTLSGDTDAAEIRAATIDGIDLVKQHQATRGLVNCYEQTKTGDVLDLYELPKLYQDEGLTHNVQIAFVDPAKEDLRDQADFYETVCLNRGWKIRRFATREAAIDWLQE